MSMNHTRTGLTVGLLVAAGALVTTSLTSEQAPAAAALNDPQARVHSVWLSEATPAALRDAERFFRSGAFTDAHERIAAAIDGLDVNGTPGDYFFLQALELNVRAAEGGFDPAEEGYGAWLEATPTEDVAGRFADLAIGTGNPQAVYDMRERIDAVQPDSPAAVRLAAAELEAEFSLGDASGLVDVERLAAIAARVYASPAADDILQTLWARLPGRGVEIRDADALRAVIAAYGTSAVRVGTLIDWAVIAERDGNPKEALAVLDYAEPRLVTLLDQVRWDWTRASAHFALGELDYARLHAELVRDTAHNNDLDHPFNFEHQAHILLREIEHAE